MTTTDEPALLRAILADPGDDTVRLAYADHLDENPDVPCPSCAAILSPDRGGCWPCRECGATEWAERGTVRDPSRAALAEFIRVQCKLARGVAGETHAVARLLHLARRERELWQQYAPVWFPFPGHTAAAAWDNGPHVLWCGAGRPGEYDVVTGGATRGFVSHVATTAAAFLGGLCPECDGDGKSTETACPTCMQGRPRTRDGGAYTVCCHAEPYYLDCKACHGRGRTEGIAAEVFRRHPVTSVTLSDREPDDDVHTAPSWTWWEDDELVDPDSIPSGLFALLGETPVSDWGQMRKSFDTRDAALAALSAACCTYGRALAGLPAGSPAAG